MILQLNITKYKLLVLIIFRLNSECANVNINYLALIKQNSPFFEMIAAGLNTTQLFRNAFNFTKLAKIIVVAIEN